MIGVVSKKMFFDTKKVIRKVDKATREVLGKFGGAVRKTARRSIRKAPFAIKKKKARTALGNAGLHKAISKPGNPPFSHSGELKKLIWFGYDTKARSVVVGPARLNQKIGNAPEALEHGGTSVFMVGGRTKNRTKKSVTIKARPFMGPAFAKNLPTLPAKWANSVKP